MEWVSSLLGNACGGTGSVGDPHLVLFCYFFQDKAKVPLLAGHPCPVFIPLVLPYAHREVWSPDTLPRLLCAQSWGPPQKCRLSLSMHFPCSKQAGGQQGLSRLSDRGAERPRGKVLSHSAVRRSSAPLKCSHLAAPSSETV